MYENPFCFDAIFNCLFKMLVLTKSFYKIELNLAGIKTTWVSDLIISLNVVLFLNVPILLPGWY